MAVNISQSEFLPELEVEPQFLIKILVDKPKIYLQQNI